MTLKNANVLQDITKLERTVCNFKLVDVDKIRFQSMENVSATPNQYTLKQISHAFYAKQAHIKMRSLQDVRNALVNAGSAYRRIYASAAMKGIF